MVQRIIYNNTKYLNDVNVLKESIDELLDNGIIINESNNNIPRTFSDVFRNLSRLNIESKVSDYDGDLQIQIFNIGKMPDGKNKIKKFAAFANLANRFADKAEKFYTDGGKKQVTITDDCGNKVTFSKTSIGAMAADGAVATAAAAARGVAAVGHGLYQGAKAAVKGAGKILNTPAVITNPSPAS